MTPLEPRALRAVALIVAGLLALAAAVAVYLRPAPAPPVVHVPDLASDMDWISYREGWLSVLDRQAGTTTLFHTTDAGRHWTRERVSPALETVDFVDSRHGVLYDLGSPGQPSGPNAAVSSYRTGDGGRHWQKLALPKGAAAQRPSFADARNGLVWDPSPAGLYATSDGGGHWRRLDAVGLPGRGPVPRMVGFLDGSHAWAAGPAGPSAPALYATSDGGERWAALPLPAPAGGWPVGSDFEVGPAAISADGRGQVMVSELGPWGFGQVALSHWISATTDAGATWSAPRRMPDVPPGTVVSLSTSRADGSVAWAWSAGEVLATRDTGRSWTRPNIPESWSIDRLQVIDADIVWVAASVTDTRGNAHWSLFMTRDAGATWTQAKPPKLT